MTNQSAARALPAAETNQSEREKGEDGDFGNRPVVTELAGAAGSRPRRGETAAGGAGPGSGNGAAAPARGDPLRAQKPRPTRGLGRVRSGAPPPAQGRGLLAGLP